MEQDITIPDFQKRKKEKPFNGRWKCMTCPNRLKKDIKK